MLKIIAVIVIIVAGLVLLLEIGKVIKSKKWDSAFSSFLVSVCSLAVALCTLYATGGIKAQIEKYDTVETLSSGWSNSGSPRKEYTIEQINAGVLGNDIVFNSISDSTIGHEFNFVGAKENAGINTALNSDWHANEIEAKKGKTYLVRLYCHNNSPLGYEAVAEDVQIRFDIKDTKFVKNNDLSLPGYENGYYGAVVYGQIYSSNATPDLYSDSVKFVSKSPFHLEYVNHTARLENNAVGKDGGIDLNDRIVCDWIKIGYDKLDGKLPGCYQYACYTAITVMPVFDES